MRSNQISALEKNNQRQTCHHDILHTRLKKPAQRLMLFSPQDIFLFNLNIEERRSPGDEVVFIYKILLTIIIVS